MLKRLVPVLALVAVACSDETPPAGGAPPAPRPLAFSADPGAGAAVVLRPKTTSDKELVVDVVAQGAPALSGVAFRLAWNPDVLKLRGVTPAPAWPAERVELSSEPKPGLLLAALGVRGDRAGLAAGDAVVATIAFDVAKRGPATLAFVKERSTAYEQQSGAPVPGLAWRGGELK